MNILSKSLEELATASGGNPVITTLVVMLFSYMFNTFMASIETMLFGGRFEHWLDPIFIAAFIAYAALAVIACADYDRNQGKNEPKNLSHSPTHTQ